jgi:hypothetical protein
VAFQHPADVPSTGALNLHEIGNWQTASAFAFGKRFTCVEARGGTKVLIQL